jgi:ubiquinone/menaquinone biosynthesis C-methylase UbiE
MTMDHQIDQTQAAGQNTYVFDTDSPEELVRLIMMDQVTTRAMGGPLAGLPALPKHANVIDLACGPGGWVLEAAHARPDIEVCGVDISKSIINYANARALSQGRHNASFEVMDITKPLDFAANSFDLVNARFVTTVLPTDYWPIFLQECRRIVRPGGILRLIENEFWGFTNSPACERVRVLGCHLLHATNHGFSLDGQTFGITPLVARFLQKASFQQVQQSIHMVNYSAGTEAWSEFYHNMELGCILAARKARQLGIRREPGDKHIMERALAEMQQEDFCAIWWFLSTWGIKPDA